MNLQHNWKTPLKKYNTNRNENINIYKKRFSQWIPDYGNIARLSLSNLPTLRILNYRALILGKRKIISITFNNHVACLSSASTWERCFANLKYNYNTISLIEVIYQLLSKIFTNSLMAISQLMG